MPCFFIVFKRQKNALLFGFFRQKLAGFYFDLFFSCFKLNLSPEKRQLKGEINESRT